MSGITDENWLVPGLADFKKILDTKDKLELPVQTYNLFGIEPEASTPDGRIPDSWVDDEGIRHAVVWPAGEDSRMRIVKQGDDWVILDEAPF